MTGPVVVDLMSERVLLAITNGRALMGIELTKDDALVIIAELMDCVKAILEGDSVAPDFPTFIQELTE